ncbi:MAG: ABC transporter permease [Candidatus Rokuibacteriota bacterium]|nr:MAG: ABC transporter permease [Candidatus Rokubacteria bacterium]PYO16467.1 MAG: ABC transporter permease [Candidatus Rokubacteria bacterium]
MVQMAGPIAFHARHTLVTTLIGFGAAVGLGLLLGFLIGASVTARDALYPLLVGFNSVPKAAVVPMLVMWFGIGAVPAVLTAFLLAFFPVAVNVALGLATLEAELRDVLRVLGASRWQIFRKVGVPRTMPLFFASLKVAVSSAFVGSVISETVASNAGIGYLMAVAASDFNTRLAFGGLFVLAAMGVALYGVFAAIERRVTGWAYAE